MLEVLTYRDVCKYLRDKYLTYLLIASKVFKERKRSEHLFKGEEWGVPGGA